MDPLFGLPRTSAAIATTIQSASLYDLAVVAIRPPRPLRPSANFCERATGGQGAQNVLYIELLLYGVLPGKDIKNAAHVLPVVLACYQM